MTLKTIALTCPGDGRAWCSDWPGSSRPGVDLALGEAHLTQVALGQPAVVTASSLPGAALDGSLGRLVPVAAGGLAGGATYRAAVVLDDPAPLPLGASVQVAIVVDQPAAVPVVPTRALHGSGDAASVLVVGRSGVDSRSVRLGLAAEARPRSPAAWPSATSFSSTTLPPTLRRWRPRAEQRPLLAHL